MSLMIAFLLAVAGVGATPGASSLSGSAKITSASAYYDRAEGFAYFSGKVFVEDAAYLLHADRAYVFMDGTNELKRIVALGHVAITNEMKRAYGEKATYYHSPGMVVLSGGAGAPAEVREVTPDGERMVRGAKIRFWTATKQVEVVEAEISAPVQKDASGSIKDILGR